MKRMVFLLFLLTVLCTVGGIASTAQAPTVYVPKTVQLSGGHLYAFYEGQFSWEEAGAMAARYRASLPAADSVWEICRLTNEDATCRVWVSFDSNIPQILVGDRKQRAASKDNASVVLVFPVPASPASSVTVAKTKYARYDETLPYDVCKAYVEALGGTLLTVEDTLPDFVKPLIFGGAKPRYILDKDSYLTGGAPVDDGFCVVPAVEQNGQFVRLPYYPTETVSWGFLAVFPADNPMAVSHDAVLTNTKDGTLLSCRVQNQTSQPQKAVLLAASYNDEGRMTQVRRYPLSLAGGGFSDVSGCVSSARDVSRVQLMLLRSVSGMEPILPAVSHDEEPSPIVSESEPYTDLSDKRPSFSLPDVTCVTGTSKGELSQTGLSLLFQNGNAALRISEINISENKVVDAVSDTACGYTTYHGRSCFKIAANSQNRSGMLISLQTPLLASSVQKMTLTFMSGSDASASSARVLKGNAALDSDMVNDYQNASMGGGSADWKTIDLHLNDPMSLADPDGYIRVFKFYVRDKTGTDFYIRSIVFESDIRITARVTVTDTNLTGKKQALSCVADRIAEQLSAYRVGADFTVTAKSYTANSSQNSGSLSYTVQFSTRENTVQTETLTAQIPALSGVWLENANSAYGATHTHADQYKTNFSDGGILYLTDNQINAKEGLKTVQYAVVPSGTAFDGDTVVWHSPEWLSLSGSTFSLYCNAFMSYAETLSEGEDYLFLVRGVTNRDNYVLHLLIPFTYQKHCPFVQAMLINEKKKIENLPPFSVSGDTLVKAAEEATQKLQSCIADPRIKATVTPVLIGESTFTYEVNLTYTNDTPIGKHASFIAEGRPRQDFYAFCGSAFCLTNQIAWRNSTQEPRIRLFSPLDGQTKLSLTHDRMRAFLTAPYGETVIEQYADGYHEDSYPLPVRFMWEDTGSKSYYLEIAENAAFSKSMRFHVFEAQKDLYNLVPGTTYYWRVSDGAGSSKIYRFTTDDFPLRTIYIDGIYNMRDLGGWSTQDGKRIGFKKVYRSAWLNTITGEGFAALPMLGIKTEIELTTDTPYPSPLGDEVEMVASSIKWYASIVEHKEEYGEAVRCALLPFADGSKYPIVFHCTLGRDRTGTLSVLLLSLLGVREEDIVREYHLTMFSKAGRYDNSTLQGLNPYFFRLLSALKACDESGDLHNGTVAYLRSIGLTDAQMNAICDNLLEDR